MTDEKINLAKDDTLTKLDIFKGRYIKLDTQELAYQINILIIKNLLYRYATNITKIKKTEKVLFLFNE